MFKKQMLLVPALILTLFLSSRGAQAQETSPLPQQEFYEGVVTKVLAETDVGADNRYTQNLQIVLSTGPQKGETIEIERGFIDTVYQDQLYRPGDQLIISKLSNLESGETYYHIADTYRTDALWYLLATFVLFIVVLAGFKGIRSLLSLGLSFFLLITILVPRILAGADPVPLAFVTALLIAAVTMFLTHGLNRESVVSFVGTAISLMVTTALAVFFTNLAHLTGFGSEEALFLQSGSSRIASMKGLLLSGMLIAGLGVIDDITVTQTSIVFELAKANRKLSVADLYARALKVGKDHISSVTNTLVLAYAGASFPLFLLFYQNALVPGWVAINSEVIAEEIVSTLVGSLGLIFSVPITTLLAALVVKKVKTTG